MASNSCHRERCRQVEGQHECTCRNFTGAMPHHWEVSYNRCAGVLQHKLDLEGRAQAGHSSMHLQRCRTGIGGISLQTGTQQHQQLSGHGGSIGETWWLKQYAWRQAAVHARQLCALSGTLLDACCAEDRPASGPGPCQMLGLCAHMVASRLQPLLRLRWSALQRARAVCPMLTTIFHRSS